VKQLTFDAETEKGVTASFLGNETLAAVYSRVLMGEVAPGGTDLYMITHTMGNDLTLEGSSLVAEPPNPVPGNSVRLTVTAQNLGDTAQTAIPVTFFRGDPSNGGVIISEATISGPLKPGDSQNVSIDWVVPMTTTPVTIYAVIDPTATIAERFRARQHRSSFIRIR